MEGGRRRGGRVRGKEGRRGKVEGGDMGRGWEQERRVKRGECGRKAC